MEKQGRWFWTIAGVWVALGTMAGVLLLEMLPRWRWTAPGRSPSQATAPLGNPSDHLLGMVRELQSARSLGLSFDDRGKRLLARRFGPPTLFSRILGYRQARILSSGSFVVRGRKAYHECHLKEFPRGPLRAIDLIATTVLVDCPDQFVSTFTMWQRVPHHERPVPSARADLRGTAADLAFVTDELELYDSAGQLCPGKLVVTHPPPGQQAAP